MHHFLMCPPIYFDIEYEINPWMSIQRKVHTTLAMEQWQKLYQTILQCGASVELISPTAGCPDMVFTANAGLSDHGKIILSHFRHPERQKEMPYFKAWFEHEKYEILNPLIENTSHYFEGAGDTLIANDLYFCAYGFRTSREFYENTSYFPKDKIIYCELVNPHFYHLDTCFCPLNDQFALWYPHAFNIESQIRMRNSIELIAVNDEEANRFACNAVVINQHVILPTGCDNIAKTLEHYGFITHACDMSEFMKAGGACKCLTLLLRNDDAKAKTLF